jgi:hypothetical protein
MVRFPAGHLVAGILDEDLSGTPRKGFDALAKLVRSYDRILVTAAWVQAAALG